MYPIGLFSARSIENKSDLLGTVVSLAVEVGVTKRAADKSRNNSEGPELACYS